jgi:hypothetical protein
MESSVMTTEALNKDREALIEHSIPFFEEVKDMTASTEIELWLNLRYGPESELYQTLAGLVKKGVEDGWPANIEIGDATYRRSRIAEPSERTRYFSITAVYMDSTGNTQGHPDHRFRGQFHGHPHGEFNLVVPVTPGAELNGPSVGARLAGPRRRPVASTTLRLGAAP